MCLVHRRETVSRVAKPPHQLKRGWNWSRMKHATRHPSLVTRHPSPVTRHPSPVEQRVRSFGQKVGSSGPKSCQFWPESLQFGPKSWWFSTVFRFSCHLLLTTHHSPPNRHQLSNRKFARLCQESVVLGQKSSSFPQFCHTLKDLHESFRKKVLREAPGSVSPSPRSAKGHSPPRRCTQFSALSTRQYWACVKANEV